MTIDKEKLKQLLSAQVSLHKVAKETGTIEDENVYLNADDALNEYLDDRGIYIEDVALALLAEIERLETWRTAFLAEREAQIRQRDQLRADNEALRSLVLSSLEEGKGLPGAGGNAPGHCHAVPGVWDRGNGDRSGTACGWCRIWNAAQAMAKEAPHG